MFEKRLNVPYVGDGGGSDGREDKVMRSRV